MLVIDKNLFHGFSLVVTEDYRIGARWQLAYIHLLVMFADDSELSRLIHQGAQGIVDLDTV